MKNFKLSSKYLPKGDQPKAIDELIKNFNIYLNSQILLGVTGSGKTFTVANVIAKINKPTLVIAHNKTLAAQLVQEYRSFFPKNAVEYFVSYYDYYQPEAYIPSTDTYIEKESQINDEIDRLRHKATQALLTRKDVIIVASVSCIYGIGSPEAYKNAVCEFNVGQKYDTDAIRKRLIEMQFTRNDLDLKRGTFRLHGGILEIMPMHKESIYRITGDTSIDKIVEYEPFNISKRKERNHLTIYSAKHYVIETEKQEQAIQDIKAELKDFSKKLEKENKILELERIKRRTKYDLELIQEVGYCNGIENYSRHFDGRLAGEPPHTLLDYFPKDFLLVIDESHVTIPQIQGMYAGDLSRKNVLIENGFRLPSAKDNRPLTFREFEQKVNQVLYTTATPGPYEEEYSKAIVEQIIRPTGLIDPELIIKPAQGQIEDLIKQINYTINNKQRILITTLTKKMAEDLSDYLQSINYKVKYLHSSVETIERIKILQELREGKFDILVGVNLLREGLDLPEVSLVAILDADKEGFLRSARSLIQTIGRAARNVDGKVLLYADRITPSMKIAIDETNRRRKIQIQYNKKNNITPKTIQKEINSIANNIEIAEIKIDPIEKEGIETDLNQRIKEKEKMMKQAAKELQFELAAVLRDEITILLKMQKDQKRFQ